MEAWHSYFFVLHPIRLAKHAYDASETWPSSPRESASAAEYPAQFPRERPRGIFSASPSGVQVAALHKVIDIDGGTAQKIEFQRLFFVFHALRQTLRIERLFNGLRHQRPALLLNARFPHLLFNCGTFTGINMPVALGCKDRGRGSGARCVNLTVIPASRTAVHPDARCAPCLCICSIRRSLQ